MGICKLQKRRRSWRWREGRTDTLSYPACTRAISSPSHGRLLSRSFNV